MFIQCEWIEGRSNFSAHYMLQTPDKDNWMLHPKIGYGQIVKLSQYTIPTIKKLRTGLRWYPSAQAWQLVAREQYCKFSIFLIPSVPDVIEFKKGIGNNFSPYEVSGNLVSEVCKNHADEMANICLEYLSIDVDYDKVGHRVQ